MVVAEVESWESKQRIMSSKNRFRGTKKYIDHDLTREERMIQREIICIAREERLKTNRSK